MIVTTSAGRLALRRTLLKTTKITKRTKSTSTSPQSPPSIPTPPPNATAPAPKAIPGPSWPWLEPLGAPFRAYSRVQRNRPYLTQLLSTLTIYFLGDLSAQKLAPSHDSADPDSRPSYSPARTLRALIIGSISSIPSYRWFLWLGESFNYSSKILSLATKVVVNQLVFTPIFNSYFFGMQSLLSGAAPAEIAEHVRHTVPISWWNSCKFWPAVTAFSFSFVPVQFRNMFAGVIAIGWQTYLSLLNQHATEEEEAEHETMQERVTHRVAA